MAKLIDIEGIGPDDAELLEATGWTDAHALAKADPEVLTREIADANAMLKLVARTPERRRVERWIAAAARAIDPDVPKLPRARRPAAAAVEAHPDRSRRKRSAEKNGRAATSSQAVQEELSLAEKAATEEEQEQEAGPATAALEDQSGEEALAAVAGPVNFEADPDVAEMLAIAPFALPMPARQLAEKGIAPSEIAVAPLLNRALGDLDVRVYVERSSRKDLPGAPTSNRRTTATAAVQVADVGFSMGRRGFDSTKIRTIEDAQGEAPPVRAASTSAVQDERINLLRTPLEKTNRGRKPSSRFYIRGVLHDRPLRIWFGGLITILLQLTIPLAIIAAPLLILSDERPDFAWVPAWVIAFPLAVPVLGVLYAFVSSGAKCRVCAQRLYWPKHCLKNRKAHHIPLLGYIGAVALHVMVFRWFNCTFCGTAIRIKK